ncbi:MAG: type II toxin-antitoxin system mRNA interferase toxin, RelE/StbE family [Patescibacteria group bacterium]
MEVLFTPHFKRAAKRLPASMRRMVEERMELFMEDPFAALLKTHKLTGTLKGYWAFSIDYRIRVIFSFDGRTKAILHEIGDHSIYE